MEHGARLRHLLERNHCSRLGSEVNLRTNGRYLLKHAAGLERIHIERADEPRAKT